MKMNPSPVTKNDIKVKRENGLLLNKNNNELDDIKHTY